MIFFVADYFQIKKINVIHVQMYENLISHSILYRFFFITEDECIYAPLLYHTFYDTEVLIL